MIFALIFLLIPTFLLLTACTIAGQVGSIGFSTTFQAARFAYSRRSHPFFHCLNSLAGNRCSPPPPCIKYSKSFLSLSVQALIGLAFDFWSHGLVSNEIYVSFCGGGRRTYSNQQRRHQCSVMVVLMQVVFGRRWMLSINFGKPVKCTLDLTGQRQVAS